LNRDGIKIFLVIKLLHGRMGGAERLFCDTANLFADAGFDVTCLYCDASAGRPFYDLSPRVSLVNLHSGEARRAPWYRALSRARKRYARHPSPALAPLDWLAKNLYFIRRLHAAIRGADPDVVISFLPPANTPALIAGRLTGASVVPTNHNVPELDYRSPQRWDQNPIDRALRLWMLRSARRVHVLFPSFRDWFPPGIRDNVVVVSNFLSPEFYDVEQPEARNKEIVAAGRLTETKSYLTLVEAWGLIARRHPDWCVRLYGDGPQHGQIRRRVEQLRIADSFFLMGRRRDMKAAYLSGEIACHPALHEGFGLSVAEALACGLPVVAFADCPGVNELVRDGVNGLLVDRAGGPAAVAAGLERLIDDPRLRAELRAAAPASVARFSPAAFLRSWQQIISEVRESGA
jgi:glycosyltransferase involved in cell wall biosynthesis